MYSFIKWIGSLFERVKKRKGLWFTSLSIISISGIFLSLFFVNYLVSDVAKKTYENQKNHFQLRLKSQLLSQQERSLSIATVITHSRDLETLFNSNDLNASKRMRSWIVKLQKRVEKNLDNKNFSIELESGGKFLESKVVSGLEVGERGAYFKALVPFEGSRSNLGAVVVKERIESLVNLFKNEKREFLFMVNEAAINKVSREARKGEYTKIFKEYFIKEKVYSKKFIDSFKMVNRDKLFEDGYIKDKNYFYVIQTVFDIDGDEIGIAVIAEDMSADNSFVNLVKNLVNSVTTVALGLIVSMVLFLF